MESNLTYKSGTNGNMIETYDYTKFSAGITKKLKKISKKTNSAKKITNTLISNNKIEVYPIKKYKITDTKLSQANYYLQSNEFQTTGSDTICNFTENTARNLNLYPLHTDFSDFSSSANSFLASINNAT